MKKLIVGCFLTMIAIVALAGDHSLNDTQCSGTVCLTPAEGVQYVTISQTYGSLSASVNGLQVSTGNYALDITGDIASGVINPLGGVNFALTDVALRDPLGKNLYDATLIFHYWTTRIVSGKNRGQIVPHWELVSGALISVN